MFKLAAVFVDNEKVPTPDSFHKENYTLFKHYRIPNSFLNTDDVSIYQFFELGFIFSYINKQAQLLFPESTSDYIEQDFLNIMEKLWLAIKKYSHICRALKVDEPKIYCIDSDKAFISNLRNHMNLFINSKYPESEHFIQLGVECYDSEFSKFGFEMIESEIVNTKINEYLKNIGYDKQRFSVVNK